MMVAWLADCAEWFKTWEREVQILFTEVTRNWYQAEVLVTPRHWIKVFFLCVVKGTEAALPADVRHSFTNASNRNFERCRVDSSMWHRIMTHGTRNKCWSRLRGKLKNWRWKEICFYELIKIIPGVDNFQTMVISSRNFLPPETKCLIWEFLVNKPYSAWTLMKRFLAEELAPSNTRKYRTRTC